MKIVFNSKYARCGPGFFLVLLVLGMLIPVFAQYVQADTADVLRWAVVDKPGPIGNIVVAPSEVSKIAVSAGNVIYALDYYKPPAPPPPPPPNRVYRSKNGGSTWDNITGNLIGSGAAPPFIDITVASDKPQVVAVVTNGGKNVFLSTDGGDNWVNTNVPALAPAVTIQCIAISRAYSQNNVLLWDMAIGTAAWGNAVTDGQVWCIQVGGLVSGWQNQGVSVVLTPPAPATRAEVSAIAFSPNYRLDGAMLIVASTAVDVIANPNKTFLCLGTRDIATQKTVWNNITNYPVEIDNRGDVAGPLNRIISSIALPSDYNVTNPSNRIAFLSYNRREVGQEDANDVYRYNPDVIPNLLRLNAGSVTGAPSANISSIALYGTIKTGTAGVPSGKLLAGDYATANWPFIQVRRCLNPFDLPPSSPSWQLPAQPATGPGSAQVAWSSSGTEAYCGTSRIPDPDPLSPLPPVWPGPDESGFSRSLDNGDTWEQVSLIDTAIQICDIAPAPDSKSLFIATYSPRGVEWVWRTAGEPLGMYWGRVFGLSTCSNRLIIRLSPDYESDGTMYTAEVGESNPATAKQLGVSHTRGNYWQKYYIPQDAIDLAVADRKTLYVALPGGIIRKSISEGAIWQKAVFTGLDAEINMLSLTRNGHLLVGSRNGRVVYSADGGTNFIEIPQPVGNSAVICDVQVMADVNYVKNNIIYAATDIADKGIWRWIIGSSTEWELIDRPLLGTGERFSGLAMGEEGTLYALRMEPANLPPNAPMNAGSGGMNRSLNPAEPQAIKIEWDVINRTLPAGVTFDPTLLYHILSCLFIPLPQLLPWPPAPLPLAPVLLTPANGSNQVGNSVNFTWIHSVPPGGTAYWLQVYKVGDNSIVFNNNVGYVNSYTINNFPDDGTVYNWRVWAFDGVAWGPGSTIWNFTNNVATMPFLRLSGNIFENQLWTFSTEDPNNPVIYRFRDNLCKVGAWVNPVGQIGCDPASGRNQGANFIWEQLSLSDEYEIHMAKDNQFTLRLLDEPLTNPLYMPPSVTSPAYVINAGQGLECGHAYFWRVRTRHATTGEFIRSPWSETDAFVIKAGFRVTSPYYGVQLLAPDNGCGCPCNQPVCFSWSPYKEIKSYVFELSENADMSEPLVSTITDTTAYQYAGTLKCNASYFWRVRADEPAPSEWSAVFSFVSGEEIKPARSSPGVIATTPLWIWVVLWLGTVLVSVILVLIIRTGQK